MEMLMLIIAFVLSAALANEIEVQAMLCYMGKEPDPDSHNKYRWVIPIEDPCQCTKVRMGSVNTRTPCRPFKVTYYDTFLLSDDPVKIRKLLNCTGGKCGVPLGMEGGSIPDSSITASTTHPICSTSDGRLNNGGISEAGAWCPRDGDVHASWFQVDLGEQTQVEGVITQGRSTQNVYATAYQVQYSDDETDWQYVTDGTNGNSAQTFTGNEDGQTPVTNMFTKPIHARYIRIRPTAYNMYRPSLRIELIGCRYLN